MSSNKYNKIDLINIANSYNIPIKNRQKKIKTKAELFNTLKKKNKLIGGDYIYYMKLRNLVGNLENNFQKVIEFFKNKNNKDKYFLKFLIYLECKYQIFNKLIINEEFENPIEFVFYKKDLKNYKKNYSYKRNPSGNIKIIKLLNNQYYINEMLIYFQQNTSLSFSGSCIRKKIRLRINKIDDNKLFDKDEVFCIPENNIYIKKITDQTKNSYNPGNIINSEQSQNSLRQPLRQPSLRQSSLRHSLRQPSIQSNIKNVNNYDINKKLIKILKDCKIPKYIDDQFMDREKILNTFFLIRMNKIEIESNIISKNNTNTNTCSNKLFDILINNDIRIYNYKLMFIILENQIQQSGIDQGGISRTIFDHFYDIYLQKFIREDNITGKFNFLPSHKILKNFIKATNILILLGIKCKLSIPLIINDNIINLFNEIDKYKDINNYIENLNLEDKQLINKFTKTKIPKTQYFNNKILNLLNVNSISNITYEPKNTIRINDYMSKNHYQIFDLKHSYYNSFDDIIKKHIIFRIYLYNLSFINYTNFLILYKWYKFYYNKEYTNNLNKHTSILNNKQLRLYGFKFIDKIDYSFNNFLKELIIISNKKMYSIENFNQKIKKKTIKIFSNSNSNYKNINHIIKYIKGSDINRKNFRKYVTGSEFSNSKIIIKFYKVPKNHKLSIHAHTCFNLVDVYNYPIMTYEQIEEEFKPKTVLKFEEI